MSLKLFACGDVVNTTANNSFIDEKLRSIIKDSDIAICNLEAPIETEGVNAIKKAGPHIYQSKESIKYLQETGFNYVSLANNHIYDFGQKGLQNTIKKLKKYDFTYIGGGIDFQDAYKTSIIEKNGIRLGILAACENEFGCLYEKQNRGGYAWLFHYLIDDNIKKLKRECDFVLLIAHAGLEDIDFPIKEWRDRYQRLCDIGVDVIIGHHPHVPQGYEAYGNSLIFYSLGNFYFDTLSFVNKEDDSFSVCLRFKRDKKIDFEIIYHKKINRKTCLMDKENVNFSLENLNMLLGESYHELNNSISIEKFNEYYLSYYEQAIERFPQNGSLTLKIKWLIKKILLPLFLKKEKNLEKRMLLLLHNIRIDTHRFVVQRALSILYERAK